MAGARKIAAIPAATSSATAASPGASMRRLGCFDRALTLDPFYPDVYMHLQSQALYQLGRYPEAAAMLKRRVLRNPDTDSSRVLLAAAYGQMGQIEEAREAWRERSA